MSTSPGVINVSDDNFASDVIAASQTRPVVVDFWAAWCGPCRALGPILEEAAARHGGVTLAKLDVDANPRTAAAFGIRGIPAVKAFRDGRVAAEFVGLQSRGQVERFLESLAPPVMAALPADEAGLAALLEADPDDAGARRALARLLLDAHRLDDAEAVLSPALSDPVADGLRARVEMLRCGDAGVVPHNGDDVTRLPDVIAALRGSVEPERSRLRRIAVGIIEAERARSFGGAVSLRARVGALLISRGAKSRARRAGRSAHRPARSVQVSLAPRGDRERPPSRCPRRAPDRHRG